MLRRGDALSSRNSHLLYSGVGLSCLCASVAILAATIDFPGVVRSMDGLAVVQEHIHIDTGGTYRTSDSGEFTIPASEGLKVGGEVVFHVSHWVVLRPCELQNGRTYLPAQGRPIQIKVLRPGDPRLKSIVPVESALGCTIEEAAAHFPTDFVLKKRRKPSGANRPEPSVHFGVDKAYAFAVNTLPRVDRSRIEMIDVSYGAQPEQVTLSAYSYFAVEGEREEFIKRKAPELGFSADELTSAIDAWAESAKDPYERGLAAWWYGHPAEASKYISESISSTPEVEVKRYVPLARAALEQGDYAAAEAALRKVLTIHENDSVVLNDLGIVLNARPGSGDDGLTPSDQSSPMVLWQQMGILQRIIVVVLFAMFGVAMGITIDRWMAFTAAREQSRAFAPAVAGALREGNIDGAIKIAEHNRKSHLAKVVSAGLMEFKVGLARGETPDETIEASRRALVRTEAVVRAELKRGLVGLGTIGSTAGLVGLVGAVMGIMKALNGVSERKPISQIWIAGGVDEALVIMAIALFVAIFSATTFKYLSGRVKAFDVEMQNSSSELINYVSRWRRSIRRS